MTANPIIYSCSGCSNVAQLANDIALDLDQRNLAQMSCIAGVGGKVKPLVKLARSGRLIVALDGCPLHCVKACLKSVDVQADIHLTLTEQGCKKRAYEGTNINEVEAWSQQIEGLICAESKKRYR